LSEVSVDLALPRESVLVKGDGSPIAFFAEGVDRAPSIYRVEYFSTGSPKIYKKALAAPRDEQGKSRAALRRRGNERQGDWERRVREGE